MAPLPVPSGGSEACDQDPNCEGLYRLLSRILAREADAPLLAVLGALEHDLSWSPADLPWLEPELRALPPRQALDALAVDFCNLFVLPGAPCPPFASVQRGEALLGGRMGARLHRFLEAQGLEVNLHSAIAAPDHLAVYLSALAELHATPGTSELRREWVQTEILPWAPGLLERVAREAQRALYRTAAHLARELLDTEAGPTAQFAVS
jgi:TorA maturation chaperone TorD